jgi:hypothetical protein
LEPIAMSPHEMIPPSRRPGAGAPALVRWAGLFALAAGGAIAVLALMVVAATAALIGLVVGGLVVLALRLTASSRRRPQHVELLEGRRTADGWVVEAISKK